VEKPGPAQATGSFALGIVLLSTSLVLVFGLLWKEPCASGDWADGRQYRPPRICYSDIVPLYGTEHLQGGRLPYFDACPSGSGQCDEYPVLTMYLMRLGAWLRGGYAGFFHANAVLLAGCALLTAWLLYRMVGMRALYFALAPTLLIYAFVNWDLLAVALATAGTYAYLRRQDAASGGLLGLGAAAKLYPGFLAVPFALGRLKERKTAEAVQLIVWVVVAYAAVNLPVAIAASSSWKTFFRFNADRPADWDSLWFVACQRLHGGTGCAWSPHLIDGVSVAVFAAVCVVLYLAKRGLEPDFPRWAFGFPLIAAFLVTNKVYSPQYGLWLLPWFALTLPNPGLFGLFEAADVAVFFTRFTWFGRLSAETGSPAFAGFHGAPLGAFELAVVIRAAILLACVAAWLVRTSEEVPQPLPTSPRPLRASEVAE
jgi:Glycosyltransferase family 87